MNLLQVLIPSMCTAAQADCGAGYGLLLRGQPCLPLEPPPGTQILPYALYAPFMRSPQHRLTRLLLPLFVVAALVLGSCSSSRKLTYFEDLKGTGTQAEDIRTDTDNLIQPDDLLGITVVTLNAESNVLFNSGVMQATGSTSAVASTGKINDGYSVDKNGAINFPVLGKVKLGGLTKAQATDKIANEINAKYVKNPIVNIRYLNFKITVVGEVNRPSSFTLPTERINLLEALAMAGDLTVYGKRENVLVIREKDGKRSFIRVNLAQKSTFESSSFYLQQNDVVYVEPIKTRALQTGTSSFYLPLISTVLSIVSVIVLFTR